MERTIKIKKGADQLGVNIEVVDQGVNGVVVSSLVRNGAVHKDGRLHAGDFILSVNNESMRNITNSQARAILRRTQLVSTDVSICYIRGQDAAAFREASLLQYRSGQQEQHQQSQQPQQQTSPRSPYVPRGDSSEDETGGGINSDLTRSITAPSFITRDLRSRDPSHEDLLGSISSLPHQPETEVGGLTVINIKHALSETLADTRAEESNISSVHIGGEESKNIEDESEEGPFTITFKNVSEAHPEYNPKVGLEPEAEDHEVLGVLQGDGGLTAAPSEGRSSTASPMLDGKHWGPERTVEVRRDDKNSLGISIVGGKVDLSWSGSSVTGIFIKNVLPDSPAGKGGHLKTGDRILEVEGVDLRGATHEKAVEVIKKTGNPVTFVVQSLVQWTPANSAPPSRDASRLGTRMPNSISPARTPTPELIQASTPLSEGSSHQQPIQPTERHHPPDPRVTFPVAPPIPETSTPIHELYPEPVKFVPESPISEPDDPDPLVNPYYYYAHAALAHWHERAQRTQEQVPEGDGNNSDQENSTSSSSASSTASRRFLQLRSFGNSSEVQGRTVTENKLDTPPSDVPLMDTPPSDVPPMDDSPEDEPKPSEVPVVEIEPLTKEIHNLQTEPAAVPPLPIITKCTDHIENAPHPTRLMLDDFPLDLPLDDPPVGAYTYDWRTDPHLYQGWWCVEGSVSEHLAAQVPTQPVSPYDSPADTPTPNTPTTDQVRLPISILPTHAYAPNPPSFLHPDWALKVIGHSMKLTCDVAQRDTISVHNITIP
ncbi:uncharacterized protein LOC119589053 isoform X3 [Penaeus monodon]|uniref:uncharacterized protein LOC119589053 isoform X3 n=1 Tax=Penaeus monodon TaxID=6687 RepID=UPI0018A752FD|nr:uncharacterized protein LOC119589053 isoform X3 [Penaeus monodon]